MAPDVNLWLHLLAFAGYTGATLAVVVIFLPLVRAESDPVRRHRTAAAVLRIYDPLTIAVLGVLVMTGAFNLTGYKAALQGLFFERIGSILAWKLLFTFLLINLAAYMAFGIGHRLVRHGTDGDPLDPQWVDAMLKRLSASAIISLLLVAVIAWLSLQLTHAAAPAAAAYAG